VNKYVDSGIATYCIRPNYKYIVEIKVKVLQYEFSYYVTLPTIYAKMIAGINPNNNKNSGFIHTKKWGGIWCNINGNFKSGAGIANFNNITYIVIATTLSILIDTNWNYINPLSFPYPKLNKNNKFSITIAGPIDAIKYPNVNAKNGSNPNNYYDKNIYDNDSVIWGSIINLVIWNILDFIAV